MTIIEILEDTSDVKSRSTEKLKRQLEALSRARYWHNPSFYRIRRELESRNARQWVHEDVFGHTFSGE